MLTKDDIKSLSILARIAVSEDEEESLAHDLDSVLTYVSEVSVVATGVIDAEIQLELKNVMREDTNEHTGGQFTDAILNNAPKTEDGYVRVPKII